MAGRPRKEGLDYFELDCRLDTKVRMIQAQYGLKGFSIVVMLFQYIYGVHGYYGELDDDSLFLFATDYVSTGESTNIIKDVVCACIRRGIFSEEMYRKYSILTSAGIQKRYLNAVKKREQIILKKEYLLIKVGKNLKNVAINSIYDGRNSIDSGRNAQSRVEDIKDIYIGSPAGNVPFEDMELERRFQLYLLTRSQHGVDKDAMDDNRIMALRQELLDAGSTLEERKAILSKATAGVWKHLNYRQTSKETKTDNRKKNGTKQNRFNDFPQRDYDYEELEKQLLDY